MPARPRGAVRVSTRRLNLLGDRRSALIADTALKQAVASILPSLSKDASREIKKGKGRKSGLLRGHAHDFDRKVQMGTHTRGGGTVRKPPPVTFRGEPQNG